MSCNPDFISLTKRLRMCPMDIVAATVLSCLTFSISPHLPEFPSQHFNTQSKPNNVNVLIVPLFKEPKTRLKILPWPSCDRMTPRTNKITRKNNISSRLTWFLLDLVDAWTNKNQMEWNEWEWIIYACLAPIQPPESYVWAEYADL